MAKLSAPEIARYAYRAGWRGTTINSPLVIAVAVALGESGGRTDARGDTTITDAKWGPSIGLWQIRSLNAEKGKGTQRDEIANLDPQTNANHAYQIWKDQGFRPWTVYTRQIYLLHIPKAMAAIANIDVDEIIEDITPDIISETAEAVKVPIGILNWLTNPANLLRIGQVVLGGVLIVGGLFIFARPYAERTAGAVIQTVVPVGKATKAIKKVT